MNKEETCNLEAVEDAEDVLYCDCEDGEFVNGRREG